MPCNLLIRTFTVYGNKRSIPWNLQHVTHEYERIILLEKQSESPAFVLLHLDYSVIVIIMTEQRKAVIKNADMSEDMQQDAVDIASQALSKYNIEKVKWKLFLTYD